MTLEDQLNHETHTTSLMTEKEDRETEQTPATGLNENSFDELLRSADALIKNSKLAGYGEFVRPFTRQFLTQTRELFHQDLETYNETNENYRVAVNYALQLRLVTISFFVFLHIVPFILFVSAPFLFSRGANAAIESETTTSVVLSFLLKPEIGILVVVAFWAFAYLLRSLVRRDRLNAIGGNATQFANHFFKVISGIHDQAVRAVDLSHEDRMLMPDWPERSSGWIKIALWFGRRYEYLDRYVTATCWKIESDYRRMEEIFRGIKLTLVVIVLLFAVYMQFSDLPSLPLAFAVLSSILFATSAYLLWIRSGKGNAFWSEAFRESISDFDAQKEHVFNLTASQVSADKRFILGQFRISQNQKDKDRD